MPAHSPASRRASAAAARRSNAAAARTSAAPAARPSRSGANSAPSHGSPVHAPAYRRGPASARPSAPASAASGQPAFGERCFAASRRMVRHAARRHDTAHSKAPVSRDGAQFAASSRRAAKRPNSSCRGVRCPIMLSSVLIALYAASPGRPKSRYQNSGATTPSLRFSPADSMAARAAPASSRLCASRPARRRTPRRPASRPVSRPRAMSRTASCRPRQASSALASAASTNHPQGAASRPRSMSQPASAAPATSPAAAAAPRRARFVPSRLKRRSSAATARPNMATGWGMRRYNHGGSPTAISTRKARRTGSMQRPCARAATAVKRAAAGETR